MVRRLRLLAMLIALLVCTAAAQTDSQTPYTICGPSHPASEGRPCPTPPRAIFSPDPKYSDEARHHNVQGTVVLWLVVGADGKPSNIKVTRSLGHGLDEEAIDAVKRWKFEPATLNGQPVPVEVSVEVNFSLYGKPGEQPASPPSPAPAARQDANTLFANASSAHAMHDYGAAIPLAIRVTEMYPQHNYAWNLLGLCYLELDELPKAEDAFKRQIVVAPQSVFAYSNLGRVYARQRKFDMAIAQFRKQIEINLRDPYAHANLGGSLRAEGKCDQAIPEYQLATELTPENAALHLGLAECYFDQRKQDSGVAELDKAAALTSSGPGWNTLAWTMAKHQTQLDRAEQYARLAVTMDSSPLATVSLDPLTPGAYGRTRALAAAWDTLGWILFLRSDFTSAEKYLMASWTLSRSPTGADHLAQLAEKLGRKDDAVKYSRLAVAEGQVLSEVQDSDAEAVSNSRARLVRLASPSPAASKQISQDAQLWVGQQDSFVLANPGKHSGRAEFALLRIHGQSSAKARWMAGDPSFKDFESEVAARMPAGPADVGTIDVLRWGTLRCEKPDAECNFRLSSAREAFYAQLRSTVKPAMATSDSTGAAISPALSSTPASTSENPPQHIQVAQGISQGLLLYQVQPSYPPLAHQARVQGTVTLQAMIGKDGTIQELNVISGHPMLIEAALDAVKQWRYKPYFLNGEPVLVETTINVNFTLSGSPSEAQPNQPAAQSSSPESGGSHPPQTPQAGQGVASDQFPGVYRVGGDVTPPRTTYAPDPQYSEEARKAMFEGTVVLWLVVDANGLPQKIKVQRSLGMGLDEEAAKAVQQWRFQPAEKNGKPVPVMINVEVNFKLWALGPPPASPEHPPRFPGVDAVRYPLVVRVTSNFKGTIAEAGEERQVSLSCKPEASACGHVLDGVYPAKWMDGKDHIAILGLDGGHSGKWKTLDYMVDRASPAANAAQDVASDPVLSGLQQELHRSFDNLKKPPVPVYFLAYQLTDNHAIQVVASFGALMSSTDLHTRLLDVDLRVGDYALDNTHAGEGEPPMNSFAERFGETPMPIEGAIDVLQRAVWAETDRKYKIAVERWQSVKTATEVKAEQEDKSADFSHESPRQYMEPEAAFKFDRKAAEEQARRYSARFAKHPGVLQGAVEISGEIETRRFVNSDGSVIRISMPFYRIMVNASTRAADGMQLPLHLTYLAFSPESLPSDEAVIAAIDQLSEKLAQLRSAPVAEPYTGPAILSGRASAVFFHEIFGHRVEGARQKSQTDAQTFKKQVHQRVLPDFLSVYSDPTQLRTGQQDLVGYYKYDDEGVQANRVTVVENGILKNFLMSRSPIEGFPKSNGHGRRQQGNDVVARQSNLIVEASQQVSRAELKQKLIELVKAANKPYGLYFEDVEGGFTFTQRIIPNAFSVRPTIVYRIYPNGREELVRGLDLIGTPLTAFSKIVAADDEVGVFNGMCGAESGWVPVSAVSPGLLVSQMEVQLKAKSQEREPILPGPAAKP